MCVGMCVCVWSEFLTTIHIALLEKVNDSQRSNYSLIQKCKEGVYLCAINGTHFYFLLFVGVDNW